MPLSAQRIIQYVEEGTLFVDPFNPKNAKGSSLDVCLGQYYFRMQHAPSGAVRNMYEPDSARQLWGQPQKAKPLKESSLDYRMFDFLRRTINPDELVIFLEPKEIILAHTHEFIGSKNGFVGEIKGRSTIRRNAFSICSDGNWGDPGYIGRWTMFIENHSFFCVPLVVGRRITQIVFHEVQGPADDYSKEGGGGKYQTAASMTEIKAKWKPEDFLPKMHNDREVGNANEMFLMEHVS